MNFYYVQPDRVFGNQLTLKDQEAHHAARVMRSSVGDVLYVVDGRGNRYRAEVTSIDNKQIDLTIIDHQTVSRAKTDLILAMGLIKKRQRLEFAVEKAVELGATKILLFKSQRTERSKVRMDRLEGKALSAMKQSLQAWLPEIKLLPSLDAVMELHREATTWIAHEKADIKDQLPEDAADEDEDALLLVGPEGGFTEQEMESALEHDAQKISLGPNRLRTETAAISLLSLFQHQRR